MNRNLNERGIYNFAQDTGYVRGFLRNLEEIPEHETNIQVIYTGEIGEKVVGHWICTRSDGNGNVHIYDSFNANHLNHDVYEP